jgi:hypothetical protein
VDPNVFDRHRGRHLSQCSGRHVASRRVGERLRADDEARARLKSPSRSTIGRLGRPFCRPWLASLRSVISQYRTQPDAGAEKFLGIDGFAIDSGLVMQVRPRGTSGGTYTANNLSHPDRLALSHFE